MSDKINIIQIVGKHSPLLAAALEHHESTEVYRENIKAAIKEIVETIIDKCAEKSFNTCDDSEFYDAVKVENILNVKTMINYE